MKAKELADQIDAMVYSIRERIMGVGAEQYDNGDTQKIEIKRPSQILQETLEEIDDSVVYLGHLRARIAQIKSEMGNALDLFDQIHPYASLNLEMSEIIKKIRHLHRPLSAYDDGDYCGADDEAYPCATIKVLDGKD